MGVKVKSLKSLKEMHRNLGGNTKGFYITQYGIDISTGKNISINVEIARYTSPIQSASHRLVNGHIFKHR